MSITSYGLLLLLLVVMATVGGIGGYAGYTVSGVPQGGAMSESTPGILGVIEWVWDSIAFLFNMATFQVDNMPAVINVIFVVMSLMTVFLIVKLARGSD